MKKIISIIAIILCAVMLLGLLARFSDNIKGIITGDKNAAADPDNKSFLDKVVDKVAEKLEDAGIVEKPLEDPKILTYVRMETTPGYSLASTDIYPLDIYYLVDMDKVKGLEADGYTVTIGMLTSSGSAQDYKVTDLQVSLKDQVLSKVPNESDVSLYAAYSTDKAIVQSNNLGRKGSNIGITESPQSEYSVLENYVYSGSYNTVFASRAFVCVTDKNGNTSVFYCNGGYGTFKSIYQLNNPT